MLALLNANRHVGTPPSPTDLHLWMFITHLQTMALSNEPPLINPALHIRST